MFLLHRSSKSSLGSRPITLVRSGHRLTGKRTAICRTWRSCSRKKQESVSESGPSQCYQIEVERMLVKRECRAFSKDTGFNTLAGVWRTVLLCCWGCFWSWVIALFYDKWVGFPDGSDGKEFAYSAGDLGQEYSLEKGMATHSRNSCLKNSTDRGAWLAVVLRVTKSWTGLKS